MLSKRRGNRDEENKTDDKGNALQSQFKYMIFVWNGKKAGAMVKAMALTKGYELDGLLSKAKDNVLQVFFAGGVIRGKKLQRGSVYVFDDVIGSKMRDSHEAQRDNPNDPSAK